LKRGNGLTVDIEVDEGLKVMCAKPCAECRMREFEQMNLPVCVFGGREFSASSISRGSALEMWEYVAQIAYALLHLKFI
jgi:hypothetical protein